MFAHLKWFASDGFSLHLSQLCEVRPRGAVGNVSDSRARDPGSNSFVSPSADSRREVVSNWKKCVHEVLLNRIGNLSLPRKIMVRLTDHPNMAIAVYRGRKQQYNNNKSFAKCRDAL